MADLDLQHSKSHEGEDYFLPRSRPMGRLHVYERTAAVAPLALRLGLGTMFAAHGAQKLANWSTSTAMFDSIGFAPAGLWTALAIALELGGGLALIAGFATRFAAVALFCMQAVALVAVHLANGFFLNWGMEPGKGHGIEMNVVNLAALFALVVLGSGRYGVDSRIRLRRAGPKRPHASHARGTTVPGEPAHGDLPVTPPMTPPSGERTTPTQPYV